MSGRDYGKPYNDELRSLMDEHGLSLQETADLLGVRKHSVTAWLRPSHNRAHQLCPWFRFRTLEIALSPKQTYTKEEMMEFAKRT
jgi:hypothetical protein